METSWERYNVNKLPVIRIQFEKNVHECVFEIFFINVHPEGINREWNKPISSLKN